MKCRTRLSLLLLLLILVLSACGDGSRPAAVPTPTATPEVLSWQDQYDLGLRYLSEGSYEEAVLAFTAAIDIDPKRAEAYVGRGDAYVGWAGTLDPETQAAEISRYYENAETDYLTAIDLDALVAAVYSKLADLYLLLGNTDAALAILERGIEATEDENLEKYRDSLNESIQYVVKKEPEMTKADVVLDTPVLSDDIEYGVYSIQEETTGKTVITFSVPFDIGSKDMFYTNSDPKSIHQVKRQFVFEIWTAPGSGNTFLYDGDTNGLTLLQYGQYQAAGPYLLREDGILDLDNKNCLQLCALDGTVIETLASGYGIFKNVLDDIIYFCYSEEQVGKSLSGIVEYQIFSYNLNTSNKEHLHDVMATTISEIGENYVTYFYDDLGFYKPATVLFNQNGVHTTEKILTSTDIKNMVLAYYNTHYSDQGHYQVFDDEILVSPDGSSLFLTVRIQPSDPIYASNGLANILFAEVTVDRISGEMYSQYGDGDFITDLW